MLLRRASHKAPTLKNQAHTRNTMLAVTDPVPRTYKMQSRRQEDFAARALFVLYSRSRLEAAPLTKVLLTKALVRSCPEVSRQTVVTQAFDTFTDS